MMNRVISLAMVALLAGVPSITITESSQAQTMQDRKAEADRLNQQGNQQYYKSQYREAFQSWEQALQIYREIKNLNGEATSLNNLGAAYNSLGQYQKAIEYYQQSGGVTKLLNRL
ncbi:MAG: tetratricopeptide repeat protein [Pseudanabaena sp. ELA607]